MTSANAWRDEQRAKHRALTPLNRATTAAFERCVANGGHQRSEDRVVRDDSGIMREIRLCAVCRVPILTLKGWGSAISSARGGRRA